MKKIVGLVLLALSVGFFQKIPAWGDEFKNREAVIAQYKKWLDTLGPEGSRYWVRLDDKRRPHRLYVGEASSARTFAARNVLSIPIPIILPAIRKSLCSSISLMRARICR